MSGLPAAPDDVAWVIELKSGQPASAEDFFRGQDSGNRVLYVWPDLMDAVCAFSRCVQTVISGMTVSWLGISASEIRASLELTGVPVSDWPATSSDISEMGRIVSGELNRRSRK